MNWAIVKKTPRYNPYMFELCRNLDGLSKREFAKRAGLTTKRYSDIENGNIEPTEQEVTVITESQTHVLKTFFEKWWETTIDISVGWGQVVYINYYKYKVFRNLNPPPLQMVQNEPIELVKPTAIILSFK